MDIVKLFTPYKAVSSSKISNTNLDHSFLNLLLPEPIIDNSAKNRAKKVSKQIEDLNREDLINYIYDEQDWVGLPDAEITSDYTKIPESWKLYSNLISQKIKVKARQARNFFMKRLSITKEQASGIVGVLLSETNLDETSFNRLEKATKKLYGAGIGSWTSSDIKNRIKNLLLNISGKDKGEIENYSFEELLEAYAQDLENHPNIFNKLKNTTTVDDAADIITRGVENGGMTGKLVSKKWFDTGYSWIKGKDSLGNKYTNHYQAAMYNVDPKYAIGRIISSRITYSLS